MRRMWHKQFAVITLAALTSQTVGLPFAVANPTGPSVVAGQAAINGIGTHQVTITQASQQAIINWQSFNIAPNEVTHFIQPNVQAIALNRIFDQNPSQILGRLEANGTVILLNRNGIMFGPNAQVDVGGLIASTHHLSDANFLAGNYLFQGSSVEGLVKNAGAIRGSHDGVYLLAANVENSGLIESPGGNVVLAAGRTAYLSNRPDGRGFLAEITAPLGRAVNFKDILADGGQVTLAGRVVSQEGLIQANSVRQTSGKIELLASEAVTLKDGSRTIARGGDSGLSSGGTVRAVADLKTGTATFSQGAVIDVSGGKSGGNAGFAEVSATSVSMHGQFFGRALAGYTGGRFLIDPSCTVSGVACTVDAAEINSFANSGASRVEFRSAPGAGLTVSGTYDLAAGEWQLPAGQRGTIQFIASAGDLLFQNFTLTNRGSGVPWDYRAVANQHIRFNQSFLETGFGGNIDFTATNGSISLAQSTNVGGILNVSGALSTIRTSEAGGNITLNAHQNVISPSALLVDSNLDSSSRARFGGIRLDGTGNLTITAGGDFLGGRVNGTSVGPGFVLTNGIANVTARQIGAPKTGSSSANQSYAQLTMASGEINLTATSGNVYLGRIQDKGLTDLASGFSLPDGIPSPNLSITVDPANRVTVNVNQGDLYLNPTQTNFAAANIYPATFRANVPRGNINIESTVNFWGSTNGAFSLLAGKNIQGTLIGSPTPLTGQYQYMFVGTPSQHGSWVLVDVTQYFNNPVLVRFSTSINKDSVADPFRTVLSPRLAKGDGSLPDNPVYVFVGDAGQGGQWIVVNRQEAASNPVLASYMSRPVPQGAPPKWSNDQTDAPTVFPFSPGGLAQVAIAQSQVYTPKFNGVQPSNADMISIARGGYQETAVIPDHNPVPIRLEAGLAGIPGEGNIRGLDVRFGSKLFNNQVTIRAPGDLEAFNATLAAPQGLESIVDVGGTIRFSGITAGQSGITFIGTGTGRVQVAGDLDLGTSKGIVMQSRSPLVPADQNKGGLLDVGVGGRLTMDRSHILTINGASISIHGINKTQVVNDNATVRIENGDPVALVGRPAPGSSDTIVVDATNDRGQIVPQVVTFEGKALNFNPSQVQRADAAPGTNITVNVGLVERNGQLYSLNGERVVALRIDGKLVVYNGDVVFVKPVLHVQPNGTVLRDGGTVVLANASSIREFSGVGGNVKVGSNTTTNITDNTINQVKGIVTVAGGGIDIRANGDIDVEKSTLGFPGAGVTPYLAGDINLLSTQGRISAGSGSRNDVVRQVIRLTNDPNDPGIQIETPGSGVFTYHGSDQGPGQQLVFPRFDDPEINAVRNQIARAGFLGQDTTALRAKERDLLAAREPMFKQTFENFIVSKQLGNISIVARRGDIIVPEAGIRGRRIGLFAPNGNLDLQGGVIAGLTSLVAAAVQGNIGSSFTGTVSGGAGGSSISGSSSAGGGSLGGISGTTGSVSAAASSATAATTSSTVKTSETVQEAATEATGQGAEARAKQMASTSDSDGKKKTIAQSVKMKRGVLIQVDVKPQAQPGS